MARRLLKSERHLAEVDPVMADLVHRLGPCTLRRRRVADPFEALVRSIVAQMISGKAARTIYGRLLELLGEDVPTPAVVARRPEARLRSVGLSRTKAQALRELAKRVQSEELPLDRMVRWKNERITKALVDVPGIGPWTARMFLMFHLARPDVFPSKDLGIQEGIKQAYELAQRPTPREARERAEVWAPYRSTAAWYLWRVLGGPVVD